MAKFPKNRCRQPGAALNAPPIQPIGERFPAWAQQDVELALFARDARVVEVAGTFNNWHPEANPLVRISSDEWSTHLMLGSF